MKNCLLSFIALCLIVSCSNPKEEERPSSWHGEWKATWVTDPASFEGIQGFTHFTMPGVFTFDKDSLNIQAFGFEGCVFGKDTLDNKLVWKVSSDSLFLINDENTPGMIYTVKEASDDLIRLQLMEDIFVTLEK